MITAVDCTILRTDNRVLVPEFFEYYSQSKRYLADIDALCTGATRRRISRKNLGTVEIPLPPLPEQKRIVAILDEAFQGIDRAVANTEKNLANARELFESYMDAIFTSTGEGWETSQIGDVAKIINGGTPKSNVAEFWDGDVLWITPKDMGKLTDVYVGDTSRKITEAGLAKSSAKIIPANSVILSTRAPIGHLAINTEPMATNQGCRGLVPSGRMLTKFLFYFLSANVRRLDDLGTGTTFKELAKSALAGVEIPLPPLPEQKRIVAILDELKANSTGLVCAARRKLDLLAGLKQSILHKAFAGELTAEPVLAEAGA